MPVDEKIAFPDENTSPVDKARREFLQKSAKVAYVAPVLVALAVNKASAGTSGGNPPPPRGDIPPPPQ